MCELFGKSKSTINEHINNIFDEGELNINSVVRKFRTTAEDGKNYLNEDEMKQLKLIVEQFLAYAEMQATQQKPMYMRDWAQKLRLILTMNEKSILEHAGKISHKLAVSKATKEYEAYKAKERQLERFNSIKQLDYDVKQITNSKHKKQ